MTQCAEKLLPEGVLAFERREAKLLGCARKGIGRWICHVVRRLETHFSIRQTMPSEDKESE